MMAESTLHIVVFSWQAFGHMIPTWSCPARWRPAATTSPTFSPRATSNACPRTPPTRSSASSPSPFLPPPPPSCPREPSPPPTSPPPTPPTSCWPPSIPSGTPSPTSSPPLIPSLTGSFTAPYLYGLPPAKEQQEQPQQLPASLVFRPYQIRQGMEAAQPRTAAVDVAHCWRTARAQAEFMAIRDCDELDADWLAILHGYFYKPVVPVGLLPPARNAGANSDPHWSSILCWLDGQPPSSVVYVSLGTKAALIADLLGKLAFGLELAGAPFVWALRAPADLLLPEGFVARIVNSGWGVVATGSIIKGLGFGRPLVMLPVLHDQDINAQAVAAKKVGVEIERDLEDGSFTRESVARAVRLLLAEEGGEEIKANAKKMERVCRNRERNERYVDRLAQLLRDHHSRSPAAAAVATSATGE